ncbi:MAG: hypothetical protein EOO83_02955 [Oxalobacteraceae bacterium]|nr:MAG: hypothetical protein EOO83_02955 [Oxalobacteraceae bacterium]
MSAQKYIEHVFLNAIYSGSFDRDYARKWIASDRLRSAFMSAMQKSFVEYGFNIGNRYTNIVDRHMRQMREAGVLSVDGDEYTGEFLHFEVSNKDSYVKAKIDESGVGERLERLGADALFNALKRAAVEEGWALPDQRDDSPESEAITENAQAPASDRIVSFSDNQITELDEQTSEVIRVVEGQNQLDGQPGLREIIVGQLKAGREFIRAGSFKLYFLQITLLETLQYLAKRYEKEAIGGLAAALITALLKHIGLDA